MTSVFMSSLARGEMAAFRQAARDAIDSLGMRPVMFETEPASAQDSRRALLDRIPYCDALLLILGAEYGEPGARGVSATEEEFQEAVRHGVPVLAIVREGVEREPAQQEFINRVRGTGLPVAMDPKRTLSPAGLPWTNPRAAERDRA